MAFGVVAAVVFAAIVCEVIASAEVRPQIFNALRIVKVPEEEPIRRSEEPIQIDHHHVYIVTVIQSMSLER